MSLEEFLRNRGIPDKDITYFNEQKINDGEVESMDFNEVVFDEIEQTPKMKLLLHRSKIFDELMDAFSHDDIDLKIVEIELILPNGDSEMAYDGGGVLRDVLSEFWAQFCETCTIGTTFKVPYIRHDYSEREWLAMAKISLKVVDDVVT
ncbi:hypothetical protein JTB14_023517 [Gonioctena quinquepunctata]|nr:hypothetical protein JTB14_023517 [Gonioctena quinquepunctata]